MSDDTRLPFGLPEVRRRKESAVFDGGVISFEGGLVLLREAKRRLGVAETLAVGIRDRRNQAQFVHSLSGILRFRMIAIACDYQYADDCDRSSAKNFTVSGNAPGRVGASPLAGVSAARETATSTAERYDMFTTLDDNDLIGTARFRYLNDGCHRHRKRAGTGWCISRAHWPAGQSSEHSCGSPYKDTRARGSRCRRLACAGIRTGGEFQRFPPSSSLPRM